MRFILKIYLWYLEKQIGETYDPALSRKIDCIHFILEHDQNS